MNRRFPLFELLLVAVLLITLVACGGGNRSAVTSGVGLSTGTPQDGISRDTFRLVPQGDLDTESFSISIKELGSGDTQVDVNANSAENLPYALFELEYDAANYNPTNVEFSDFFGSDVLTAGITTKSGNVGLAVVPIHYDEKPGVSGDGNILSVRFENAPARTVSVAGGPPTDYRDLDLTLTGTGATGTDNFTGATWPMILIGDGDISAEVGVPDITPIALGYLAIPSDTGNEALFVVDYDGDDEIGVPDITPIATQYLEKVDGYNVYHDTVSTFDIATAALDGSVTIDTAKTDPIYETNGMLQFAYTFANVPGAGETWYYFAVPYANDNEGTPIEGVLVSAPLTVTGGGTPPHAPRIDAFTIGIVGEGVDQDCLSGDTPYDAAFIANEGYTFTVVSAQVAFWNEGNQAYDAAITIDSTHADWETTWETGIAWATDAPAGAFTFDNATGSGAIGTVGPDDPYTFEVTGTLGAASIDKVVTVNVTAAIDPKAPLLNAVEPPNVETKNIATTEHVVFLNMNDDAAGTTPYTMAWLPTDGGTQVDFTLAAVTEPEDLAAGQFYVEEREDIIHGTTHMLHFRSHYQVGEYRFLVTNNIGRQNSINHPPVDGTTPTAMTFTVIPVDVEPVPLRSVPVTVFDTQTRVVIMPENPRVQKYPAISFPGSPPDTRYQNYVRDDDPANGCGYEFVPYLEAVGDPDNMKSAPWVRAYTTDPFPGGVFDTGAPFIASTALKETKQFNPSNTAEWVSDWNIREWNRVVMETTSDTIFPPQTNPSDNYYLVVFGLQNDWENLVPTGVGSFHKIGGPTPFEDIPAIKGIADADLAFDTERDGVAPQSSEWPILEYPTAAGVEFDWSDLVRRDGYSLFVLADYIHPDVYFGRTTDATCYRDNSIILYDDAAGANLLGRTTGNTTVASEVYCATVKPYKFDTNSGVTPNTPPGVGDAAIEYNDNDTGWMICPIAELDRFDLLLPFYQTFYVGVGIWNPDSKVWVDSPAPLAQPFTITNYTG